MSELIKKLEEIGKIVLEEVNKTNGFEIPQNRKDNPTWRCHILALATCAKLTRKLDESKIRVYSERSSPNTTHLITVYDGLGIHFEDNGVEVEKYTGNNSKDYTKSFINPKSLNLIPEF